MVRIRNSLFHRKIGIANFDSCFNITLKNFSVNWDCFFISHGKIVNTTDQYVDIFIDHQKYPYIIENKHIQFLDENSAKLQSFNVYNTHYDKDRKEILYKSWDRPFCKIVYNEV